MSAAAPAPPTSAEPRLSPLVGVAVLTGLAAVLRFGTLNAQSFWLDESTTVRLVGLDFGAMLAAVGREEVTPPLFYVVAWGWAALFGAGEVGLRSLSALLGTALVPVGYLVGRELARPRAALLVCALVAVSPLLVWYSQEARSYALLALLGGLSLLFFLRALRTGSGVEAIGWAVASGLALAAHYFAIFLVAAEGIWLLVARPRRWTVAALALVGLTGVALLPTALRQQSGPGVEWIAGHPLLGRVILVPKKFMLGETGFLLPGVKVAAAALVLAALFLLLRADRDERRSAGRAAALTALVVSPPLLLALIGLDYLVARNLLVGWLPAVVVVAIGAAGRRAGRTGTVVAVGLVGLLAAVTIATSIVTALGREDWRGLAAELATPSQHRLIAVKPGHEARSLRQYLGGLEQPRSGIRVPELVVVQTNRAGPQPTPPAPPEFELVGRRERQRLTLIRYRSLDPRGAGAGVVARELGGGRTSLLLQPGHSR